MLHNQFNDKNLVNLFTPKEEEYSGIIFSNSIYIYVFVSFLSHYARISFLHQTCRTELITNLKLEFSNPYTLQPDGVNLRYFDLEFSWIEYLKK